MCNARFMVCQYTILINGIMMVFQQYFNTGDTSDFIVFVISAVVMEQPSRSIDDLQPQDLSTSSNSSVIELTEEGSKVASVDTLQVASNCCPNSGAGNHGQTSDIRLQSGDNRIRPDIALPHTTVTVSYMSRSNISSNDSLSPHLTLCGVPKMSQLHVCPPGYPDTKFRETGISLEKQYSAKVERPVVLETQIELFQTSSAAQIRPERFGSNLRQDTNEVNGGVAFSDWVLNKHMLGGEEHSLPQAKAYGLENGHIDSCSRSGVCAQWSPETLAHVAGEDEDTAGADVLILMSKTKDPVLFPDALAPGDTCLQERNCIIPLVDPFSSPTLHTEDLFVLPQASSSSSSESSYLQMANEAATDSNGTQCANPLDSHVASATAEFHASDKNIVPLQKQKAPLINLTDDICKSNDVQSKMASHVNGHAEMPHGTMEGKKVPAHCGRGTQFETPAADINFNSQFANDWKNNTPLKRNKIRKAKVLVKVEQVADVPLKKKKRDNTSTDKHQCSTTYYEANNLQKPPSSTRPKSRLTMEGKLYLPVVPSAAKRIVMPLSLKSSKSSRDGAKYSSAGCNPLPACKRKSASTPRKRHRRPRLTPTSNMFSPKEPEIKLRYVNFKKEKQQCGSWDSFSPFVHVERQQQKQPFLCTVINYPEESRLATQPMSGQPTLPGGLVSTTVPSTSCLQLGRVAMHGQHHHVLVCCLCGLSANAMYLGDLHGPYYPEGFLSATKSEDAGSDCRRCEHVDKCTDVKATSQSIRARRRKWAAPLGPQSSGITLKSRGLRIKQWQYNGGPRTSPTKWVWANTASSTSCSAEDWYSPPLLPADPSEFWLHEDCCVWSTGIFLIRGKVYGLEEAVRAAQETVRTHSVNRRVCDPHLPLFSERCLIALLVCHPLAVRPVDPVAVRKIASLRDSFLSTKLLRLSFKSACRPNVGPVILNERCVQWMFSVFYCNVPVAVMDRQPGQSGTVQTQVRSTKITVIHETCLTFSRLRAGEVTYISPPDLYMPT